MVEGRFYLKVICVYDMVTRQHVNCVPSQQVPALFSLTFAIKLYIVNPRVH